MRKRLFNWHGQRFVYLGLEGEPGLPVPTQAQKLFERAAAELTSDGLAMDRNVVRTRVFGRTREDRTVVSDVRAKAFNGKARAASSSYISPAHFSSGADVALDLFAMAEPTDGQSRRVTEHTPPQPFIRHLVWGPMVFLAGMTCEELPTLPEQYKDVLNRACVLLHETGCGWKEVVRVSFFLHRQEDPQALLKGVAATIPVPLDNTEIELVEGFSRPGKLVEVEITAKR